MEVAVSSLLSQLTRPSGSACHETASENHASDASARDVPMGWPGAFPIRSFMYLMRSKRFFYIEDSFGSPLVLCFCKELK